MINRTKTLKEFMTSEEYEHVIQNATQFSEVSLPVWHLEVTGKCLHELSNFDLIRCIRQDIFTNLSIFEIIERMDEQHTPFYAEIDSIEIMEKLSSVSSKILLEHKEKLIKIFENVEQNDLIESADVWMFDEQKEMYQGYIDKIKKKIH